MITNYGAFQIAKRVFKHRKGFGLAIDASVRATTFQNDLNGPEKDCFFVRFVGGWAAPFRVCICKKTGNVLGLPF